MRGWSLVPHSWPLLSVWGPWRAWRALVHWHLFHACVPSRTPCLRWQRFACPKVSPIHIHGHVRVGADKAGQGPGQGPKSALSSLVQGWTRPASLVQPCPGGQFHSKHKKIYFYVLQILVCTCRFQMSSCDVCVGGALRRRIIRAKHVG